MVLINQRVAAEMDTLTARHRYSVEDSRDTVRAAEATSAQRNAELQRAAEQRVKAVAERFGKAAKEHERSANGNGWGPRRSEEHNEIQLDEGFPEYDEQAQEATPPPVASPRPAPRRQLQFDEDDDFEHRSWLR